ncbi:putative inactive dehydrogenase EasA [Mycena sanguinolenta]|uniref:Putative inactive dehydrogenase EasA n=1 Tax=Mycena sanguinolenta TaxID=230812 RepID=A0A8H6XIA6_9AGAR|nr:putative inactive dehydrogenase EasA [Mycena sanguinolenta]
MSSSKLFQPTTIGDIELSHRIILAPTTRFRADAGHAPFPHVAEYYEQRASTPGSFLISEATLIAPRAGGYKHAPGIWSDEQISAWKAVADRVHAKGCYMYLQLWALGRTADVETLAEDGLPFVSASDVPIHGGATPRPLTIEEIEEYIQLYVTAALNAVNRAGFDGVEVHAANGYLLDQFLHDGSNTRTDRYGGSIENRTRFPLEVVDAVVKAVGQKKTALRVSPWGTVEGMQFIDGDPRPTYTSLITELRDRFPDLAYLHVVEPRVDGSYTVDIKDGYSNDFIRKIWGERRLISAGGYTRESAIAAADERGDLVAFGRGYIANPDLPYRLLHAITLTVGNRALYYAPGSVDPKGYTDYPFANAIRAY